MGSSRYELLPALVTAEPPKCTFGRLLEGIPGFNGRLQDPLSKIL